MKKLDLILYIKSGKLNFILYLMALLIVLIPICIVFVTNVPFSATFSKISISTSLFLVITGKVLTLLKRDKGDKNIPTDIGIIIGLLIVFISNILK